MEESSLRAQEKRIAREKSRIGRYFSFFLLPFGPILELTVITCHFIGHYQLEKKYIKNVTIK